MAVYVDEIIHWPTHIKVFLHGSCHMTADTLKELHDMANKLGLSPKWFQNKSVPHYDLTPRRREEALRLGVTFKPAKEQTRERLRTRGFNLRR